MPTLLKDKPNNNIISKCPKCGGIFIYKDEDGYYACFCGWRGYHLDNHGNKPKCKRGHFKKTSSNKDTIIKLYKEGYGIRPIGEKTGLSKNTVNSILQENKGLINLKAAEFQRKRRIREK